MPIANFPANLAIAIQQGYLERRFEDALKARLGYRALADKEAFPNGIGETITRTRGGLLQPVTQPLNPSTNTNLDNGLSPTSWSVEQYTVAINQYASTMDLNIVGDKVGIASQFLQNATRLGEQASRSLDLLVRGTLLDAYLGGNTRVTTTLGAPGVTVAVDDIRGFQFVIPTSGANSGKQVAVSASNTMAVQVGATVYTLTGVTADVSNVSTAISVGGISGTLTFSAPVTVLDGTAGNAVIGSFAPTIIRPNARTTTLALQSTDKLTLDLLRSASTRLNDNAVPQFDWGYTVVMSETSKQQLFNDPEFQLLFRGTEFKSLEYKKFIVSDLLGMAIATTNVPPVQTLGSIKVQRPFMGGQDVAIEGDFEGQDEVLSNKYPTDQYELTKVDSVTMVTRGQLDRLKQIIAQSWFFIGGWCCPTDQTSNPTTIPTASTAYYKRGVFLETA